MEEPAVPTQRRHDHTLGWRWGLAIAALGLSLLLIGLGDTRALTRHEVLAAQPAREMLASGNWIIPTIGGVPRTIKPPTTGWFIAASMAVFRSEAEWVARLPAVLAGVLTAVVVASLTARYFGRAAGAVAGFAQLTFYYTLMQARLAEADMLLSAAVTIAMTAFAVANVESPRAPRSDARWLPWLFYFAAGASMLLKLIAGPAFIFATAGCYWLWTRDRRVLRFLLNPIGIAIFLVVVASWYGAAAWTYPQIVQT
ncbi:MAG TPA: glycosyltransferase family 39 protein, partial [Tepidisphaeraceae bacterium]|nr:glycosyltransferase family 39 protein [Tepidisphaeraceae bacterium]